MRVLMPAALAVFALLLSQGMDTGGAAQEVAPRVGVAEVRGSLPARLAEALGAGADPATFESSNVAMGIHREPVRSAADPTPDELTALMKQYCVVCHNDAMRTADLTLEHFDVAAATEDGETAERVIRKLRLAMMPPPGIPRPGGDTLVILADVLEARLDSAAIASPNPGGRGFQRLNRAEYTEAVRDLLGVEVDVSVYLPMDTKSENFDNIADVQQMSPTLLDAYLGAAAEVSRIAVGEPGTGVREETYSVSRMVSQREHIEGTPYGTRGGLSVVHNFPADGEYVFRVSFYLTTHGAFLGQTARNEQVDIAIDGERVALLDIDRFTGEADPNRVLATASIPVKAGARRVSAAFIRTTEGAHQHLVPLHEWSLTDQGQSGNPELGEIPHVRDLVISGPHHVSGISETPARRRIFTCRPEHPAEARPCAEEITERLARQAFRRSAPLPAWELESLMAFYDFAAGEDGFDEGVRTVIEAILSSPDFVFRLEPVEPQREGVSVYRLRDQDLASRLSFFLWGTLPDEQLRDLAGQGRLSEAGVLDAQVRRMLEDPRSESLATRFAAQWLRLPDLEGIEPSTPLYPDFEEHLRESMRRETELFFDHLVREDRSALELWNADYTFVNERLARHYGIPGVSGSDFRRVPVTDEHRKGLLGHASVLTLTSHATRTSPTDRGKWVMEVFLNSPPPPPPPGVPELDATSQVAEGESRLLTVRERMEIHRANPVCASCHRVIDPIGLALENFDVTGRWRIRDNWMPIDSRSELWDGTPLEKPADLRRALLERPEPLLQNFTRNLMAYALGRRVEYYDMPTIRKIVREAEANDHRMSSYILGVVQAPAFQTRAVESVAAGGEDG